MYCFTRTFPSIFLLPLRVVNMSPESSLRLYDDITLGNQVANTVNWIVKVNLLSGQYILTIIPIHSCIQRCLFVFLYFQPFFLLNIPSTGMKFDIYL